MDAGRKELPLTFMKSASQDIVRFRNTHIKMWEQVCFIRWYLILMLISVGMPNIYIKHWSKFIAAFMIMWKTEITERQRIQLRES
jgi:hypothetical protein